jgi:superfamily II DNA helicase RecQ
VPTNHPEPWQDDLNRYLQSRRVVSVEKHYEEGAWHFCVESYRAADPEPGGTAKAGRVDYKEVLEPEQFARYLKLREWRKERSDSQNIPAYSIFTNAQLAEISRLKNGNKAALGGIAGIGEKRVEQYGEEILRVLNDEAGGETVRKDC